MDHLGFQLASDEQLTAARERLQSADLAVLDEGNTSCCYANSDKHWITDPAGIAWETFRTLGSIPTFNGGVAAQPAAAACCGPAEVSVVAPVVQKTANSCGPKSGCC